MGYTNLVLDLFSGTGSATQPFVECGKHRVVRVDICRPRKGVSRAAGSDDPVGMEGSTPPAGFDFIQADVRHLPFGNDLRPEFVWASPPCQQFSKIRRIWNIPKEVDLSLVEEAIRIGKTATKGYVIENACHLKDYLGPPLARRGGFYLWGDGIARDLLLPQGRFAKFGGSWNPTRPSYIHRNEKDSGTPEGRAMIPPPITEAVHRAVCEV